MAKVIYIICLISFSVEGRVRKDSLLSSNIPGRPEVALGLSNHLNQAITRLRDARSNMSDGTNAGKARVAVDLSGNFDVNVLGPILQGGKEDIESVFELGQPPLFRCGTSRSIPQLHVGGHYDFSKAWYGLTRIMASLHLQSRRFKNMYEHPTRRSHNDNSVRVPQPIWGERINVYVQAERGLKHNSDYSSHIVFETTNDAPSGSQPVMTCSARFDSDNPSPSISMHFASRLHRLVNVVVKSTVLFTTLRRKSYFRNLSSDDVLSPTLDHFDSRLPSHSSDQWIPNLRVNTAGELLAKSEIGRFQLRDLNTGVRFMVRKQLDWSSGVMWPDSDTNVRIELIGLNQNGNALTSLILDGPLERWISECQMSITLENVCRRAVT